MDRYDVVCLPSVNGEVIHEDGAMLPPGWRGQKMALDTLQLDESRHVVTICQNGTRLEFAIPSGSQMRTGGSSVNLACGFAGCGWRVLVGAPFGNDPFRTMIATALQMRSIGLEAWAAPATANALIVIQPGRDSTVLGCRPAYHLDVPAVAGRLERVATRVLAATGVRPMEVELVRRLFVRRTAALQVFVPNPSLFRAHREATCTIIRHCDVLQMNDVETALWLGVHAFDPDQHMTAIGALGAGISIVTRGEHGAVAMTRDGRVHKVPAAPARVVDTTGAGDGFLLGFLLGYQAGRSITDCMHMGAWSAARNIEAYGGHDGMPSLAAFRDARLLE